METKGGHKKVLFLVAGPLRGGGGWTAVPLRKKELS